MNRFAAILLVAGWLPMAAGILQRRQRVARAPSNLQPEFIDRVLLVCTWFAVMGLTLVAAIDVLAATNSLRVVAGVTIFIFAIVAWLGARHSLGNAFTQLLRVPPALVTTGAYRWTRHPMYVATTIACAGQALAAGTVRAALLAALAAVIFLVRARREDDFLRRAFMTRWDAYAARTGPRFLVRSSPMDR